MVRIEFPLKSLNDTSLFYAISECLISFKSKVKKTANNSEYANSANMKEILGKLGENDNCYECVSGGLLFKISIT